MAFTSLNPSTNDQPILLGSALQTPADLDSLNLLFGFTHDLRSPLFALLGYLQLLQIQLRGNESPKVQEYLHHAQDAGQRLDRMVREMLDLLRCDRSSTRPPFAQVSVPELLRSVWNTSRPAAEQRAIQLRMTVKGDEAPTVWGCGSLLERALDNLLGNAIKFSADGGEVTLSSYRRDDAVVFEVADHGRGIPLEAQVRIFQPFVQAEEGDRMRGFGLGLPMARFVARLHGGDIELDSRVGEGSRFLLRIPHANTLAPLGETLAAG